MWSSVVIIFTALLGIVSCYPQGRVVNGTSTSIENYPFLVSLRGSTGSHSCGSSIIAPHWILTAAHCVSGATASRISIQFASSVISATSTNVAKVKRIIVHEDYRPADAYANDIALLKLFGQLVFNGKTIAAVTLPEQGFEIPQVAEGAPGILVGWGLNATGGYLQSVVQEVDLKIYSDAECTERHNGRTTSDHICGGVDEGGKGQCSGDSGGPLLYQGHIQLGIVSWSIKPCTVYPYPGVYTKVSHYIDWIQENVDEDL
ncbi:mite allergen Der p 3-like [Rhagoletis pomonella]|uniref:mite allergen Der p 3-like n=1 Tax=Rhagoletis pomonella TaxID=28610 RepID=UPI00177BE8B0|nr:mite allergen Der p 3-like [Rhagoletis pomonella]